MKRIALALLLTACGTDTSTGVSLTADTKTGEVSLKGEKGDKGDPGEQGPAGANGKDGIDGKQGAIGKDGQSGKDGAKGETGAAGKDGEALPFGIWKDALTGRQWLAIQGKFTADQMLTLCGSWRVPKNTDIIPAIQHGLIVGLTITSAGATERAWTTEVAGNNDQGAVTVIDANVLNLGAFATWSRGNQFRLYCVKE